MGILTQTLKNYALAYWQVIQLLYTYKRILNVVNISFKLFLVYISLRISNKIYWKNTTLIELNTLGIAIIK